MREYSNNIFNEIKNKVSFNPHILLTLFPRAKQKGNEIYFDAPSYNSWSYNIHKNVVKDFRTNDKGSIIDAYARYYGITIMDAVSVMSSKLGIVVADETPKSKNPKRRCNLIKKGDDKFHHLNNVREGIDNISLDNLKCKTKSEYTYSVINKIWDECLNIKNTIAETYLNKRNISLETINKINPSALKYHPALYHSETGDTHPALVAGIYLESGKLTAIHRHYLDNEGSKLSNVKSNKKMLGKLNNEACKLINTKITNCNNLAICEGIESGLSILQNMECDVYCAISASNLANLNIPDKYHNIDVYFDYDKESSTGRKSGMIFYKNKATQEA